jgi:chromosomal replication initiation ATPase DnaA
MSARPQEVGAIQVVACSGETVMVPLYQLAQAYSKVARRAPTGDIGQIQQICATHYGVSCVDLRSARRDARITRVRHVAMYLARELTEHSFPEISGRFGGRDHTSAMYGVRKIERLIENDKRLRSDVALLRAQFAASEASP